MKTVAGITRVICSVLVMSGSAFAQDKEWTSASKPGDGSVFTFRGSKIGDPWEAKFSGYSIGYKNVDTPYCSSGMTPDTLMCTDKSIEETISPTINVKIPKIGDVPVKYLTYLYLDKRLYGFLLGFHTNHYRGLMDLLEARYGKPHVATVEVVKNRAGASFDNAVAIWHTPHGPMKMQSRASTVDSGSLVLVDVAASVTIREREKASAAGKAKSAF